MSYIEIVIVFLDFKKLLKWKKRGLGCHVGEPYPSTDEDKNKSGEWR